MGRKKPSIRNINLEIYPRSKGLTKNIFINPAKPLLNNQLIDIHSHHCKAQLSRLPIFFFVHEKLNNKATKLRRSLNCAYLNEFEVLRYLCDSQDTSVCLDSISIFAKTQGYQHPQFSPFGLLRWTVDSECTVVRIIPCLVVPSTCSECPL